MMTNVGYARVSSTGQDLAIQIEKLEPAGCDKSSEKNVLALMSVGPS